MPTVIQASRAKTFHGISTFHQQMDNGEFRFRLLHENGTGYVQTRAATNSGWQSSHVHEHAVETYIVQSGWMALAELIGGRMTIRTFAPGEIVTTVPGVTHNVYLPAGAVIHTVKHGATRGPDRSSGPDGAAFDIVTRELDTEAKIRAAAIRPIAAKAYPEEYRHFDNLIWQVPAWATAIFALSIQSVIEILGRSNLNGQQWRWAGILMLFLAASVACFSLVLARFRTHQRPFKTYSRTPIWKSATSWTQSLVTLEAAALTGVGLAFLNVLLPWAIAVAVGAGMAVIIGIEAAVRRSKH